MKRVLVLLADGFEEMECVIIVDVLRRGGLDVTLAGLAEGARVGSHGIRIVPDCSLEQVADTSSGFAALVLPGGMPGARNLREDARVLELIRRFVQDARVVGAICAAPIALEAAGVLGGRRATSYPGHALPSAEAVEERVVWDGSVVTSRGPGTAFEFALSLVEHLVSSERAAELRRAMLVA